METKWIAIMVISWIATIAVIGAADYYQKGQCRQTMIMQNYPAEKINEVCK